MPTESRVKWKLVFLYGLIVGCIILLCLYLAKVQPVRGFGDSIINYANGLLNNPTVSAIVELIKSQWIGIAGAGLAIGIPAVVGVVRSIQLKNEVQAKNQLAELAAEQSVNLINKDSELQSTKIQLESYQKDTTATELQTSLSNLKTENTLLNARYEESQKTIKSLQDQLDARPVIRTTEYK